MNVDRLDPLGFLGCECFVGGDIPATINGILKRINGDFQYEVIWWDGRQRRCEWVVPSEIKMKAREQ